MFRDSHGAENVYFHDPDGTYPVWLEKIEATGLYVQLSNLVHELTLAKRGWIHGSRDHQGLPWVLCILVRNICLCMQYNIKINFLHFGPPRYSPSVVSLRAYVAYKMHISVSAWHVSKCVSYATLMSQSQGADGIRHQSDKDLREVKIGHRCRSNWWLWPPYWPGSGRENLALKEVFIWFNYNFVNV